VAIFSQLQIRKGSLQVYSMAKNDKLKIQYKAVSSLIPYARNARTHSDSQIEQVIASIKEFGWTNPILLDGKSGIIAGHARLEAAKRIGLANVPCIELAGLTEAQKRAYVIADNKLALNAGWDLELLNLELLELKDLDFDLELLGFGEKELEKLMAPPKEKQAPVKVQESADLTSLAPSEEELKILDGRTILLEFSGGKDSSASAIWAKKYLPNSKIVLSYVDLGAEWDGFFLFLRRFAEALECEFKVLRAKENVIEAFLAKGEWPMFVGPYCHDLLHEPLDEQLTSYPADAVACIRGGRVQEKARTGKQMDSRFLTIDRLKNYVFFQPLYFTTKEAAEQIIDTSGLPKWEGYERGLCRTACRICPGQKPMAYAAIRANFPDVWKELGALERRLGPGCWQASPGPGLRASFSELADKGQEAFEEGVNHRSI